MSDSVAEKIDELLQHDKTFSTRAGMLFLVQLVRDAFRYIEAEKNKNNSENTRLDNLEDRMDDFQKTFDAFLEAWQRKQATAEEERKWWRRAMLAPVFGILITEITKLLLNR